MSKAVVITGGTTGIGLGLAREFLKRGCCVALCNLDQKQIDPVVADLTAEFGEGRAIGVQCDVTNAEQIEGLWDQAKHAFGSVDIWISNAGLPGGQLAVDAQDPDHIMQVVRVGLGGGLLCARTVIPRMAAEGGGWLWHTDGFGSQGATRPGMTTYGANKSAVGYLRKALQKEAKDMGVKIGSIRPGLILTNMVRKDGGRGYTYSEQEKKIINIIGDRVEDITPFFAEGILNAHKDGTCLKWLTPSRMLWRFAKSPFSKRDILDLPKDLSS